MSYSLDAAVYEKVLALSADGDIHAEQNHHQQAIESYKAAWTLLPEPKLNWEAATWLAAAMGDAYFMSGDFFAAKQVLWTAVLAPGGLGNPFIHLRLGQSYFELGDEAQALEELTRAYMGGGRQLFQEEHPKYFQLLEKHLEAPAGKHRL